MSKTVIKISIICFLSIATGLFVGANGQGGFDNSTRALYIFDMARYIDYGPGFADSSNFTIGVLDQTSELLWEMGNLSKTRPTIQDKPVQIVAFRSEDKIIHTQILYVNKNSGFNLKKVKDRLAGHQTMLITEGYEFRESMINFIVVDGTPQFEANEEMIRGAGMSVNQNFLFAAIKTKEDWEDLFIVADADLQIQKETVRVQAEEIELQKEEILAQRMLLDSLDRAIAEKEETLKIKEKELENQLIKLENQEGEIESQRRIIYNQQQEVKIQQDTLAAQREKIAGQITTINEQLLRIGDQEERIKIQLATLEKQKLILYFIGFALILVICLGYYIFRAYRIKKEANKRLEEKNQTISAQKEEIQKHCDQVSAQCELISYQKQHITDSIMYAKRIQAALIPSVELFSDKLDHFILFKPLSIVSGDFYWFGTEEGKHIIIAADCTGHGVPGAFMSMLGVTMLNEIVSNKKIIMPDEILNKLRDDIIHSLGQVAEGDSVKDGMDVAVCVVDFEKDILWYAGANSPLYLVRDNELIHYRADKMPVAIHYRMDPFTRHEISLKKGDAFYIFSDGYADQFGGPEDKKFMTAQLKKTLVDIVNEPMMKQGEILNEIFETWKGDSPQIDDVMLIGVRY
jgi:serine phosphatase RsbU (regulator of sigma subunit)